MASNFRITIDTEVDPYISVHLQDIIRTIFKKYGGGLYYFYTTNETFDKDQTTDYTFLNTVESNRL